MDKLIYEYICQDKYITNEYPNKYTLEKTNKYFEKLIYLSKYIQIYSNIRVFDPHCDRTYT